jgi:hypothetical protein
MPNLCKPQDKEPSNHTAMWEMLLVFVSSQKPDCWSSVNVQKAVVPRLLSLLRHGCYGSAVTSLPALLPFLAQLPRAAFALQPLLLLDQVLESIWIGQQQLGAAARGDRAVVAAVTAAYQECLAWGLRNAAALSAGDGCGSSGSNAAAVGGGSGSTAEQYSRQLLAGHFSSLLQLSVGSTNANAQLASDIVRDVLLQQCTAAPAAAAAGTASGSSSSSSTAELPPHLQVFIQPVGSNLQSTLSSCCSQQEGSAAAADAASGTPAVDTVCLRAQQLLDALADGSTPECQAAAGQLAGFCCAALLPVVQAGQQLQAPATGLLSRLIREHPGAARLPTSVAAAAAVEATSVAASPAAAAPAGTGVSSIAALVRLGISSCGSSSISSSSSSGLTAADAELLLSCVAGSSSTSAAWGLLLDEVTSEGHSVAAWRFFDTLLCHACSSNQLTAATAAAAGAAEAGMSAGESGSWSHPILDGYITQLVQQQLQQQQEVPGAGTAVPEGEGNGNDRASSSDGTAKGLTQAQAAAAALLGCCLGANKQQAVLLGEQATAECMQAMEASLSAVLQQQQQQEVRQPDAAAAPFIAALSMVLDSSTHVAASVTGSSRAALRHTTNAHSLWQQQPEALSHVLLLLWQLAWSVDRHDIDDIMCDANLGDSESEAGSSGSDGPSGSGSDGPSGSGSDGSLSDSSSDADFDLAAAAQHDTAAAAATDAASSSSSSSSRALAALCAAAAALWNPEVVSMALTELPASAASSLMQEVQQLLLQSLQKASAAAAAAGATSVSAAVHAGTQVACRAGVVLEGLSGRPEQQQELLLQLLAAVECWQHWATLSSSCKASACDNSSSSVEGGHTGLSSPVYCLMLQFASVLVLQAGCDVVLPLHHGHLLPRSSQHSDASGASSSSSSPSDADTSRLWLRLELLCANIALQQQWVSPGIACGGALGSDGLAKCVAAAAAAAERQLVRAAGKGSSGAASVVARSQLAAALAQLLASAGACCAANETTTAASQGSDEAGRALEVYSGTLQRLLGQVVAAVSTSVAARAHLQPVLSQFMRQHLKAAVLSCADRAAAAAAASAAAVEVHGPSAAATVLLAPVLAQCAHAFRFGADSDAALSASGFADLAVQLMHTATAVPSAAAGADAARLQAGGVPLPLLQLVVACFPVQGLQQQQKAQAKQQQQQLHAAASTAAERKGLAALLRHVCPANAPAAAGSTDAAATAAATAAAAAAAVQLQCQLQLCCVTYCWAEMQAAEWHIVLRDAQQRLTNARREVERAAGSLAGAVCTAAQQLLGSRGSGGADALSPAMAIQLLRRLEQKGLLQQQPAVAEALFAAATAAVQQLSQLSVLQLGLQVLVSVLQLQDKVQAAGRAPQLNLALPAAWREVLSLLLSLGAAVALVSSCGTACSDVLLQYCQDSGSTWVLLQQCLLGCSEVDGEAVGKVLAAADAKVDMLGVDAVGCCLALLQQGGFHHHHQQQQQQVQQLGPQQQQQGCEPLQELAWQLLLHPASLAGITHAATASSDGDEVGGVPEYGVYDDAAAYLVKVGLRPSMAAGLAARRPWQMHMLLWALLLGHAGTLPARSAGQRRLCQALREVPELVPEVLNRTAGLMGLGGSSKRHIAAAGAVNEGEEMPAATAAMSAAAQTALSASLQAEGTAGSTATSVLSGGAGAASSVWNVAVVLRSIGLPHSHTSWRLLAAAVYRAVLCTLPASARLWFSDLRDRSRSTAVENYTSRYESPALLAAEFAAIKRDAAGSSGEVGGSCSFRVVANPANREVTAVLEIEDGATLELVVKLPAASPLKAPEVACKNKVGIHLHLSALSLCVSHHPGVLPTDMSI